MTIQSNILLSPFTTIGLGGTARFFAACNSTTDLRDALAHAGREQLRVHILGGGSNTIFGDGEFRGLVIHTAMTGVEFVEKGGQVLVCAAAGEPWDLFVQTCIDRGLGGLECLSGIPGLVGATPMQNVGAYGQEVANTILTVEAVDRTSLQPVTFAGSECRFGYRTSRFKQDDAGRYVITAVTFSLAPSARPSIRYPELQRAVQQTVTIDTLESGKPSLTALRHAVLTLRRGKSMVIDPADPNTRSVGSFFTNPVVSRGTFEEIANRWKGDSIPHFPAGASVKIPAGWLVERAGFPKGYRKGRAGVSAHHALALVNLGGTTAELLALAGEIEHAVHLRFGIQLEREPVIVQ
jgi:UDP-N-acetylmuramate dehydrogenase